MTRTVGFVCCASLLACASMLASAGQTPAPESTPIARTAIIEAIDKANRTVTLKGSAGNSFPVRAPEGMEGFDSLKVGDQVTVTYFTAVAVSLRKPGASRARAGAADDDHATDRSHAGIRDQEGADVLGQGRRDRRESAVAQRDESRMDASSRSR